MGVSCLKLTKRDCQWALTVYGYWEKSDFYPPSIYLKNLFKLSEPLKHNRGST